MKLANGHPIKIRRMNHYASELLHSENAEIVCIAMDQATSALVQKLKDWENPAPKNTVVTYRRILCQFVSMVFEPQASLKNVEAYNTK